jgi:hypothetical protein
LFCFAADLSSPNVDRRTKAMVPYLQQLVDAVSKESGSVLALVGASALKKEGVVNTWV